MRRKKYLDSPQVPLLGTCTANFLGDSKSSLRLAEQIPFYKKASSGCSQRCRTVKDIAGNMDILIYSYLWKKINISSALDKDNNQLLININLVICSFSLVSEKSCRKKVIITLPFFANEGSSGNIIITLCYEFDV